MLLDQKELKGQYEYITELRDFPENICFDYHLFFDPKVQRELSTSPRISTNIKRSFIHKDSLRCVCPLGVLNKIRLGHKAT